MDALRQLPSWSEHVSQTTLRQTRGESQLVADVLALADPDPLGAGM